MKEAFHFHHDEEFSILYEGLWRMNLESNLFSDKSENEQIKFVGYLIQWKKEGEKSFMLLTYTLSLSFNTFNQPPRAVSETCDW